MDNSTQIERTIKPFGQGSAHVIVPKDWIGKEVLIYTKGTIPITWENIQTLIQEKLKDVDFKKIKTLIEDEIEDAKKGY